MDKKRADVIAAMIERLQRMDYISPDEVPNIDLYMDQITTFMDAKLLRSKRYPDDKILTKTMINNYTKNNLLPPPVKKKYSREHIILLIFIYYLKSFLSITDIQKLLEPITDRYFESDSDIGLPEIYEEIVKIEREQKVAVKEDVEKKLNIAMKSFEGVDEKEEDILSIYAFISMLSFDIYAKKQMIEQIIDLMAPELNLDKNMNKNKGTNKNEKTPPLK